MSTLLLRLAGPLQSWGTESRFETRRTDRYPSKSGAIGLVAAALGYSRDVEDKKLAELRALQYGVRIDREGKLLVDDHFTRPIKNAKDTNSKIKSGKVLYSVSSIKMEDDPIKVFFANRYYLSDAVFLVGLASDDTEFLRTLEHALKNPVFPLFLGRRSCPPTLPLCLGIRESGLIDSLTNEPRLTADKTPMRIVTDALDGEQGTPIRDLPLSFSPFRREYGFRSAVERYIPHDEPPTETEHDIFAELEGEPCI